MARRSGKDEVARALLIKAYNSHGYFHLEAEIVGVSASGELESLPYKDPLENLAFRALGSNSDPVGDRKLFGVGAVIKPRNGELSYHEVIGAAKVAGKVERAINKGYEVEGGPPASFADFVRRAIKPLGIKFAFYPAYRGDGRISESAYSLGDGLRFLREREKAWVRDGADSVRAYNEGREVA
jgi:hypothetical protein